MHLEESWGWGGGREADTIGYDHPYLFQLKQTDVLRVY